MKGYNPISKTLDLTDALKGAHIEKVWKRIKLCSFYDEIESLILSRDQFKFLFHVRFVPEFPPNLQRLNLKTLDFSNEQFQVCSAGIVWDELPPKLAKLVLQNKRYGESMNIWSITNSSMASR